VTAASYQPEGVVMDAVVYHRQTIKSSLNARCVEIKIESKAKERRIRVVGLSDPGRRLRVVA
jgi:hypothetical protein